MIQQMVHVRQTELLLLIDHRLSSSAATKLGETCILILYTLLRTLLSIQNKIVLNCRYCYYLEVLPLVGLLKHMVCVDDFFTALPSTTS